VGLHISWSSNFTGHDLFIPDGVSERLHVEDALGWSDYNAGMRPLTTEHDGGLDARILRKNLLYRVWSRYFPDRQEHLPPMGPGLVFSPFYIPN
jgi:hypothetical protein